MICRFYRHLFFVVILVNGIQNEDGRATVAQNRLWEEIILNLSWIKYKIRIESLVSSLCDAALQRFPLRVHF